MEIVKKQVKLITTTATTAGGDVIVVPDQSINYNFKISLITREKDFGFFEIIEQQPSYYGGYYGSESTAIGEELLD